MTENIQTTLGRRGLRKMLPISLALGLALTGLTACAPGADTADPGTGTNSGSGTDQGTGGIINAEIPPTEQLLAAAKLAQSEAGGGAVISVDLEDRGNAWEITVAGADGTETEVVISADGKTVVSPPRVEQDDAEDKAETAATVAAAKLDLAAAIDAALAAAPGFVTEIALDTDNGRTLWEADILSGDIMQRVDLDAGTGEVVTTR